MSASDYYDIIVIGAGPAGSTFCRLISNKYKVLLINKPGSKPCGGLLSPDAQRALSRYNLTLPKDILVDPQIFAVKTLDLNSGRQRYYQRAYLNLDRKKFDKWLLDMVPENITVIDGVGTDISRFKEEYTVTYTSCDTIHTVTCHYLVDACGAGSIIRRKIFKKKIRKYIAIQQEFEDIAQSPFYSCIFDKKITDCCSWTISKDNRMIYGGAFPIRGGREKFELQKEKMIEHGFIFGRESKLEACVVHRPANPFQFALYKDNAFAIGEAAGFISPSSLEGISYAMESARMLAAAFNTNNTVRKVAKAYRLKTFSQRIKIVLKLLKCPFMYRHFLRNCVLRAGIASIKIEK